MPNDLVERVKTNFQLGGHKAAAIAMVLENADVFLVSEMEEALDAAFARLGADAKVIAMPCGGSTLPCVK